MATRGRKPGFKMTDEHRLKIANSNILSRLIKCAEGEIDVSSTQAQVGLGLLRKIMPDLSNTQHSGDEDNPIVHEVKRLVVPNTGNPDR